MKAIVAIIILTLSFSVCAGVDRLPENSPLQHMKAGYFDEVAKLPNWIIKGKKLFVAVAGLHFNEEWLKETDGNLAPGFTTAIRNNFTLLFLSTLKTELGKAGFTIVESASEADVMVFGSVEDVRIYSAQKKHNVASTMRSAGSANLFVEFIEGEELKMFFSDSRETKNNETTVRKNMNKDFERMMNKFAKKAAKVLKKN